MDLRLILEQELNRIRACKEQIKQELSSCPKGSLRISRNGKFFRWRRVFPDHSRVNLKKSDITIAQQLVKKDYLENLLACRERQSTMIKSFLNAYPSTFTYPDPSASSYEELHKLFEPFQIAEAQNVETWVNEKVETNQDFPEQKTVTTKSGIMVRSKSECLIADALYNQKIPFRYEQVHRIAGLRVSPDFTILNPRDRKTIVIWEHFGLMEDGKYANSVRAKLGSYLEAGFIPGKNMIMTFEGRDWPLDINYVLLLISYFFERPAGLWL